MEEVEFLQMLKAGDAAAFHELVMHHRNRIINTCYEFTPDVDANGNYSTVAGSAYSPKDFTWTYQGTTANPLYSENISGAYWLPNGNTILCSGTIGLFLEVTPARQIVWKNICPVDQTGSLMQGTSPPADPARKDETMNSVFRIYKYPLDYPAFIGKDMTPGDFVEKYPTSVENLLNQGPSVLVYPNPFVNKIYLTGITGDETCDLFNSTGQVI